MKLPTTSLRYEVMELEVLAQDIRVIVPMKMHKEDQIEVMEYVGRAKSYLNELLQKIEAIKKEPDYAND